MQCPVWWPLILGAWWHWRNLSLPPICCQKVIAQGGEKKRAPCCALHPAWVLTWGWVHELLRVVAEQSILDVATAHAAGPCREGGMDAGDGLREAWQEVLGAFCNSGSEERYRAPRALPRISFLSWSVVSSSPGRGSPCPGRAHLQPQLETRQVPAEQPAWLGCVGSPCLRGPLTSAQHPQRRSACFGAAAQTRAAFNKNHP